MSWTFIKPFCLDSVSSSFFLPLSLSLSLTIYPRNTLYSAKHHVWSSSLPGINLEKGPHTGILSAEEPSACRVVLQQTAFPPLVSSFPLSCPLLSCYLLSSPLFSSSPVLSRNPGVPSLSDSLARVLLLGLPSSWCSHAVLMQVYLSLKHTALDCLTCYTPGALWEAQPDVFKPEKTPWINTGATSPHLTHITTQNTHHKHVDKAPLTYRVHACACNDGKYYWWFSNHCATSASC